MLVDDKDSFGHNGTKVKRVSRGPRITKVEVRIGGLLSRGTFPKVLLVLISIAKTKYKGKS